MPRVARPSSLLCRTIIFRLFSATCCCSLRSWASEPLARRRFALLHDLALELQDPRRQFGILGLEQESVEAATVIDRLERICRYAQADSAAERVRNKRHIAQIRQKPAFGLDIGVAHFVADQWL